MSYQISLQLDQRDVDALEKLLNDLRLTSPFPSSYADSATIDIPDSIPMPPNPQSLLSSIVRFPFPTRYLLEGLLSQGVVAPEDLTVLIGQLRLATDESPAKREKLLASLFSMGPISGRIQMVVEGASEACSSPLKSRPRWVYDLPACPCPSKTCARSSPPLARPSHYGSTSSWSAALLSRRPGSCSVRRPKRSACAPSGLNAGAISEADRLPSALVLCQTSNHVLREFSDRIDRFLRVQITDENDSLHYSPKWDDVGQGRYANRNDRGKKWCPGYGMIGRMRRVMDEGLKFAGRSWVRRAAAVATAAD